MNKKIVSLSENIYFSKEHFQPNMKLFGISDQVQFAYIKSTTGPFKETNLLTNNDLYLNRDDLVDYLNNNIPNGSTIIIHCYDYLMAEILERLKGKYRIVVIVHGYEFYANIRFNLLDKKTKDYLKKQTKLNPSNYVRTIRDKQYSYRKGIIWKRNLKKVDAIAHYLPGEFNLFKEKLNFKAKFIRFNYGQILNVLNVEELGDEFVSEDNIMIGSSGAVTNNHLDIFNFLKGNPPKSTYVYCPLNYSIYSEEYVSQVIKEGKIIFGEKFKPFVDFMPREEYNKILNSCNTIVSNQWRSQGTASIWSGLYRGCVIYLSSKNPLFDLFYEAGAKIFPMEKGIDPKLTLSQVEKQNNRKILLELFSDKIVKKGYKDIFTA